MLQEYIYILQILHSKFLYNYDFTPFPINFTPFFTPFSKNIFKIQFAHLSAQGIYMVCIGFPLEIPPN